MAVAAEMPKVEAVGSMSLAELREQLAKFRQDGRIHAVDQGKLESKMKEILSHLAKLGQRGGPFAQIQLSDEMMELCQRGQVAL